jgi:hypothetical protein
MLAEFAGLLIAAAVVTGILRGAARGAGRISAAEGLLYLVLLGAALWLLVGISTGAERRTDPGPDDCGLRSAYLLC